MTPEELNDELNALGCWWHLSYRPSKEGRDEGDEFDYPPAGHHFECSIVVSCDDGAEGCGDTEDEAKAAALDAYRKLFN